MLGVTLLNPRMQEEAERILYIHKTPLWAQIFFFTVLLIFIYACITKSEQLVNLWHSGLLGKFLTTFSIGAMGFFTMVLVRTKMIFTDQAIYAYTWRGCRKIPYRKIQEIYYTNEGTICFLLPDQTKIESWIAPNQRETILAKIQESEMGLNRTINLSDSMNKNST